jgi:hypothetical protein
VLHPVRIGLAALAIGLLALPAMAQPRPDRDLRQHDGSPIAGLTRSDLDGTVAERWLCQRKVEQVTALAGLFAEGIRGKQRERFVSAWRDAPDSWRSARANCDWVINSIPDGWTKTVMVDESEILERLWEALLDAATAFVEERPVEEVNGKVEAYDVVMAEWVSWLQLSSRFWAGEFLEARPDSCLIDARDRAAGMRAALWDLSRQAPDARPGEELDELQTRVTRQRHDLALCEAEEPGDLHRLELMSVDATLAAYGDAITALQAGDDSKAHDAMALEQTFLSRMVRCRAEYAEQAVTDDCRPETLRW